MLKILGRVASILLKSKKTGNVSGVKTLISSFVALIVLLLISAGLSPEIAEAMGDLVQAVGMLAVE